MVQIVCPSCGRQVDNNIPACPFCNYDITKHYNDINRELALSEIDRLSISDAQRHKNLKQNYVFLKKDVDMINTMSYPVKPRRSQVYLDTDTARLLLEYLAFAILGFMMCFASTLFYIIEALILVIYPVYIVVTNHNKYTRLRNQYNEAVNDWNGYKQKMILERIHYYSENRIHD